jgi:hypothetical protein
MMWTIASLRHPTSGRPDGIAAIEGLLGREVERLAFGNEPHQIWCVCRLTPNLVHVASVWRRTPDAD